MTSDWYREAVDPVTPQFPKNISRINSPIVQLDKDTNEFIQKHSDLKTYIRENNLNRNHYAGIYSSCSGIAKSAYGYKWMWEEDYENFKKNEHKD